MPNPKPKQSYKVIDPSAYKSQFDRFEKSGALNNDIYSDKPIPLASIKSQGFSPMAGVRDSMGRPVYTNASGTTVVQHPTLPSLVDIGNNADIKYLNNNPPVQQTTTAPVANVPTVKAPITLNPINNAPTRKPLDFGSPSGVVDPNSGKVFTSDPNAAASKQILPNVMQYNRGGLVKHIKGYDIGGMVNGENQQLQLDSHGRPIKTLPSGNPGLKSLSSAPGVIGQAGGVYNTVSTFGKIQPKPTSNDVLQDYSSGVRAADKNAVNNMVKSDSFGKPLSNAASTAGGVAQFGGAAGDLTDMATQDAYGRYNTGSKAGNYTAGIGSGLLKGAAQGASLGGGNVYAIAAGAAIGGAGGFLKARNSQKSLDSEQENIENAKRQAKANQAQMEWQDQYNQAMQQRQAGMKRGGLVKKLFADGGMINNDPQNQGMMTSESYSGATMPNNNTTPYGSGLKTTPMFGDGGKVYKLRADLSMKSGSQNMANDKQNFYRADSTGGKIEGKGTGTSDSIKAKVEPGSFVVPAKNAEKAEAIRNKILPAPKKKANLNQTNGEPVKLSAGEHMFSPEEYAELKSYGYDIDALAPNSDDKKAMKNGGLTSEKAKTMLRDNQANGQPLSKAQKKYFGYIAGGGTPKKDGGVIGYDNGGKVKPLSMTQYLALSPAERQAYDKAKNAKQTTSSQTSTPTKKQVNNSNGLTVAEMRKLTPSMNEPKGNVVPRYSPDGSVIEPTTDENSVVLNSSEGGNLSQDAKPTQDKGRGVNTKQLLGQGRDIASGLANYILPWKQTKMGLDYIAKNGDRPTDRIDATFQANVNKTNANAEFGYNAEEQAQLNNQNLAMLQSQRNAARNYSGGSGGNAYQMERQAAGDFYGRGLQGLIAGKQYQAQKQGMANEMNLNKAEMSRRLFGDRMQAWQQNTQAASGLLNQGLTNAIGAKIYNDELSMIKQREQIGNSYLNNFGQ